MALSCSIIAPAAMAQAAPQTPTGTSLDAPDPGRFAGGIGVGVMSIRMSDLRYGSITSFGGQSGLPYQGVLYTDEARAVAAMPGAFASWGFLDGVFGQRAEIFARFDTYSVTSRTTNYYPGNQKALLIPLVAPDAATQSIAFSSTINTLKLNIKREMASYDGGIGVRFHMPVGGWTISPMAELAYQRLNQTDGINGAFQGTTAYLSTITNVSTDYSAPAWASARPAR